MGNYQSWKNIIDPGFDETIKTFLSAIHYFKDIFENEKLDLTDEILEAFSPDSFTLPLSPKEINALCKSTKTDQEANKIIFINTEEIKNNFATYTNRLSKYAKKLPANSRQYYLTQIEIIIKNKDLIISSIFNKQTLTTKMEIALCHFSSTTLSLHSRYTLLKVSIPPKDTHNKTDTITADDIEFFNKIFVFFFNTLSQITQKKSITELLQAGDDDSLLATVRIFKPIVGSTHLKKRIFKAQMLGDQDFLHNLSNAIKFKPSANKLQHHETFMVLRYFWPMGLYNLKPYEVLHDFLKYDCGLLPPEYKVAFLGFLNRFKKEHFPNSTK